MGSENIPVTTVSVAGVAVPGTVEEFEGDGPYLGITVCEACGREVRQAYGDEGRCLCAICHLICSAPRMWFA